MDQDQTLESEDLLASVRVFFEGDRAQRFIIGFLFGMSFFLIVAGVAEVLLARNEVCLETLSGFRLAPDPNEICMSEFSFFLTRGLSRGVIGTLSPSNSQFIAWTVMALFFGLLGGGFAQLQVRWAIVGFLVVFVLLLAVSMSVDYMSQFIILNPGT
jgi:hypothetical protein